MAFLQFLDGLVVGNARERRGQRDTGGGKGGGAELLDDSEDVFASREAHFQIHLRELELAIGALVLIAEAAGNLKVAIEAGDHEDLFEDLRRLRKRVEVAGVNARGNQIISGPFRRAAGHDGGFDF